MMLFHKTTEHHLRQTILEYSTKQIYIDHNILHALAQKRTQQNARANNFKTQAEPKRHYITTRI